MSLKTVYAGLDARLSAEADSSGPVKGTLSGARIGMIWLAANLVVTTLLTGTLFVTAVPFPTAVTMIVVGTLVGAVVLTSIGAIGTRTGLPTIAVTPSTSGAAFDTAWNVIFSGSGVVGGSIADGQYDLSIDAAKVSLTG